MRGNVRIQLPLGPNENFIFAKIDAKRGNIIDLEYLGNGASD
jgi:hypothetical protein